LADQPIWQDDYPGIPLPADPAALLAAADTGRRMADLFDNHMPIAGVTTGKINPELAAIAVPDPAPTDTALTIGRFGVMGGDWKVDSERLLWTNEQGGLGWNGVPEHVWTFRVAGFQVIPTYLSYRVGQPLEASAREDVTHLCRRSAVLRALEPDADRHYLNALAENLTLPTKAAELSASKQQDLEPARLLLLASIRSNRLVLTRIDPDFAPSAERSTTQDLDQEPPCAAPLHQLGVAVR
jgi:Type ISP C-terminal specificity domain